ncbi:hypothetical protein [Bacteroides fragilis]|uniref:hypothetical protein n=1 Tax=Bacteroides fragilis TaxID=817 RepID=UPI001C72A87D|nr:hypothetical protein [Bacteroides fragilis]
MNARLSSDNPVRPQTVLRLSPPLGRYRGRAGYLYGAGSLGCLCEASSSEATKQVRPRLRSKFVRGDEAGSSGATKQIRFSARRSFTLILLSSY